jgi:hypothetical protein
MSEKQFTTSEEITNIHSLCNSLNLNPKHQALFFVGLSKDDPESNQNKLLCSLQGSNKTVHNALVTAMMEDQDLLHIIRDAVTSAILENLSTKLGSDLGDDDDSEKQN